MPYIKWEKRTPLHQEKPLDAGELNWALTMLVLAYIDAHGKSYQTINDILGALEGAKLEFYRRVAVPYENRKISENGDVYPA